MQQSPLTLQSRPEVFEPKIVQLYRQLFADSEDEDKTEGFWRELFLLKPDIVRLNDILKNTEPESLLQIQHHTQQLVANAIAIVKARATPSDEHALDTLTVFLNNVLSKRYHSPSSDIITILAGLDDVDVVFTDLVATLDDAIREAGNPELQSKSVKVAMSVVSGALQTVLLTYFIQRDMFPSLMHLVRSTEDTTVALQALLLVGLLANYNKFEVHNPYQTRLTELADLETMTKVARVVGLTCDGLRNNYVTIQNDLPEAWSIGGTLSYVGLGSLAGAKPVQAAPTEEEAKALFAQQPQPEVAILLPVHDLLVANRSFGAALVNAAEGSKNEFALTSLLSFSSYLLQHAHRSVRAALYGRLALVILQVLVEGATVAKRLHETSASVRLCRQRPPYLPVTKGERSLVAIIIDVMLDCINHNLRKKLDAPLYICTVEILIRLLSFLGRSRSRLAYHWSEMWRSLLAFVKFLTTYADDLRTLSDIQRLVHDVVNLITLSLTQGEAFLHDSAAYDDLFYKLVESGESLRSLRDAYKLDKSPSGSAIGTLIGVSTHYSELIKDATTGKTKNLVPREVSKIIKQGYETLSIEAREGLDQWTPYREADHKVFLKHCARAAVADARALNVVV